MTAATHPDSFEARRVVELAGQTHTLFALDAVRQAGAGDPRRLPYAIKILLENLLRHEDGETVTAADIRAVASWDPAAEPSHEIAYRPARVILQDFTGVPAVVDLAAMRDALAELGGDPKRINPLGQADLVIDHSVQVDHFGTPDAAQKNVAIEYKRNGERYALLRWGQATLENFRVVPPGTGIVHQVNLERLAPVAMVEATAGAGSPGAQPPAVFPDTLVGTDSHTTMVNGLGVLAWGVGGIEAEAAMLGQPISMLVPQVVGCRLTGTIKEGVTATDLVLTVTEKLRAHGVVGKFVEFFGDGLDHLTLADRATLGNMSPEFGSTCGIFPIDAETISYLRLTGRDDRQVALVEAYAKAQGLWRTPGEAPAAYSSVVTVELGTIEPSIAGPKRPQDRLPLGTAKPAFAAWLATQHDARPAAVEALGHGSVVVAAITSCTNTSNPSVLIAAGLLAQKARARGLTRKPWVKTSLAPGSRVVTEYLTRAGLLQPLAALGFQLVGYGCTTCIGNSGPLPEEIAAAVREQDLTVCAVLSGNRNFEGRIHPLVRANYLASPPLVVAYAIAGSLAVDLTTEPLGTGTDGAPVFLKDVWPSGDEIRAAIADAIDPAMFRASYASVFEGDARWKALPVPESERFVWDADSTYVRRPPFFEGLGLEPEPHHDLEGARVLALLGDSVTTDHISPAGAFAADSPAGRYLIERGVNPSDFNSFGSRRGNHEVMMRGTFANIRIRNRLVPGVEGGVTRHFPTGEQLSIYEAAMRYQREGVPLVVIAGREYGTGSSRDWAAKGTLLLGVRVVIARSYERIHRSNLIGMGVLPLQFAEGESAETLGLTGAETFTIRGLHTLHPAQELEVGYARDGDDTGRFRTHVRIDTGNEMTYYRHGGILSYVLRQLAAR